MFPALYHAHHSRYSEDIPFWLTLAKQHDGPILELGCGTGRILLPLANAGHSVFGLDNNASMLTHLFKVTPPDFRSRVNVIQADIRQFHLAEQFNLIILPCNTYSTFSPADRATILENLHRHLHPKGTFSVSVPNPSVLTELPRHAAPEIEDIFPHPDDLEPVQVYSAWDRTDDKFTVHWHYDHLGPNGNTERISVQIHHYLTPALKYVRELHAAGFKQIDQYGDFDFSEYCPDSPNLILTASRS